MCLEKMMPFLIFYGLIVTVFILHSFLFGFFLKRAFKKPFSLLIPIREADELFIFSVPVFTMILSFFSIQNLVNIILLGIDLSNTHQLECEKLSQKYPNVYCYTFQNLEELTNEFR